MRACVRACVKSSRCWNDRVIPPEGEGYIAVSDSGYRVVCLSVALVILVVILKEGPVAPPTFTVPLAATAATQSVNVVVEHRHFNIVRNKTLWDYNWDKLVSFSSLNI